MRIPGILPLLTLLPGALVAQCLTPPSGVTAGLVATQPPIGPEDEGRSPPIAMGFAFPMAGAASPTYSHAVVDSNGALYLTNGGAAVGTVDFEPIGVNDLRGATGASPRVFPLWTDIFTSGVATWSVTVDTSVAGRFRVNWVNVEDINASSDPFTMSATLLSSGGIEFSYSVMTGLRPRGYTGVSIGNAVGTGTETSSILIPSADSGSLGLLFQFQDYSVEGPDVNGTTVLLAPNGIGGYLSSAPCRIAYHKTYGSGCYTYRDANEAVYQRFATAAASSAALPPGTAIQFQMAGLDSYLVSNGGGSFVPPPPTATILTLADDQAVNLTPSQPFPHANGTFYSTISVSSNGFVNMAPATGPGSNGVGATPFVTVSQLLDAPAPAFRSHRDYNPAAAGSGKVKTHEAVVAGEPTLFVTWDNVYIDGTTIPERFQFQLGLTFGTVVIVWDSMAPSTPASRPLVVGMAQGTSFDPGPTVLATGLPILTAADIELQPLSLAAAPRPTFALGGSSAPITWTTSNLRDLSPAAPGAYLALLVFSVTPPFGGTGIDLGLLGVDAPGCNLLVGSLDVVLAIAPTSPVHDEVLVVPQPLSPGDTFYVQTLNLIVPSSLPNGQNGAGLLTSNGLVSRFDVQ